MRFQGRVENSIDFRRRDPMPLHKFLGEDFAALEARRTLPGPEDQQASLCEFIRNTEHQRQLRANNRQIGIELRGQIGSCNWVFQIERQALRLAGDPIITRSAPDFLYRSTLCEFPNDRVLTASASDYQYFHSHFSGENLEPYGAASAGVNHRFEAANGPPQFRRAACPAAIKDAFIGSNALGLRHHHFVSWHRGAVARKAPRAPTYADAPNNETGSLAALRLNNRFSMAGRGRYSLAYRGARHFGRVAGISDSECRTCRSRFDGAGCAYSRQSAR